MRRRALGGICLVASLMMGLGLAANAGGGIARVAGTGEPVSGTEWVFGEMMDMPTLNELGQVVFWGDMLMYWDPWVGGMPAGMGLFLSDRRGPAAPLVLSGDPAPGGGIFDLTATAGIPIYSLNNLGQVAANLYIPNSLSSQGFFRFGGGLPPISLARQGDLAPGTDGGRFMDLYTNPMWPDRPPLFNDAGQTAFYANVDGGTTPGGIFRSDGRTVAAMAVEGQAAPGTGGGVLSGAGTFHLNRVGQAAMMWGVAGGTCTSGIFVGDGSGLTLRVREGQGAPGTGGGRFGGWFDELSINASADVAFRADVVGAPSSATGLFLCKGDEVKRVAVQGQSVPEGNGKFDWLGAPQLTDSGKVVFTAMLTETLGPADYVGIYRSDGMTTEKLVRMGQPVPGTGLVLGTLGTPATANGNLVAFGAELADSLGNGVDDTGIYLTDGVEIVEVARRSAGLPSLRGMIDMLSFSAMWPVSDPTMPPPGKVINSFGQVTFWAHAVDPFMGTGQAGVFLYTPELHWRTASDGAWDTDANWTLGLRPGYVHSVVIDPAANVEIGGPEDTTIESLTIAPREGGSASLSLYGGEHLAVNDAITIGNGGYLTMSGGKLTASRIQLLAGGTFVGPSAGTLDVAAFNQLGGTVEGTLVNSGTFTYTSGTFSGRLWNKGAVVFDGDFTAGNGARNETTLTVGAGRIVAFNGLGLDNAGLMVLEGGTMGGNGPLVNNGRILCSGAAGTIGTISGSGGLINNGYLASDIGLTLANTGANVNYGQVDLAVASELRLQNATLTNRGTFNLGGAFVTGTGQLVNAEDGTLTGFGTISTAFSNRGLAVVTAGTMRLVQPFTNEGVVCLDDDSALLAATVLNAGTLEGHGHVSGAVDNSGIIEAVGGTLYFSTTVANLPGGRVVASAGNKILFGHPIAENAGTISLLGGTVQSTGPATNGPGGLITGRGTLIVGGTGLTNQGTMSLSAGLTDVLGTVQNAASGKIIVSGGGTATFWNAVDHHGTEIRVSEGCMAVFLGEVTGPGPFTGTGTKYFEGGYSPGSSAALVPLAGRVVFGDASSLVIELGGTMPGTEHDKLAIDGSVTLNGGELHVRAINAPYRPAHNDRFEILTFDSRTGDFGTTTGLDMGNRLRLVPVWNANDLTLTAVQGGSGSWRFDASGAASVPDNWVGGIPNGVDDRATFGSVIHAPRQVAVDAATVLGAVVFDSAALYTLAGPGTLTLQASSGHAEINITSLSGPHVILAPVKLLSPLDIDVESAAALTLAGPIDNSAGLTIRKIGPGTVDFDGPQTYGPGAWLDVFDGTVNLGWGAGSASAADPSIRVTDAVLNFECNQYLDTLSIGDGGKVAFAGAHVVVLKHLVMDGIDFGATTLTPEPATLSLLALGGLLALRRRR
jgi:hypothetical protein